MQWKPIVQGLAAVWLLLFGASFVALSVEEADGSFASGLNRIIAFLTWQVIAVAVAGVGAFLARHAMARGEQGLKLFGYGPIGVSVFLIGSFIAIMAVRFYAIPLLEASGFI